MSQSLTGQHNHHHDLENEVYSKTILGFWFYLLTDFILFGVLFATYAVLINKTFGGPSGGELFHLPSKLVQTMILLTSSFTIALANISVHKKNKLWTIILYALTFLLGLAFIVMDFNEFNMILSEGYSWKSSAYLSAYFTLLGIHGAHMLIALLWIFVLIIPVCYHGLKPVSIKRLTCLKMFWQFINIIWIFIFSFVYLVGAH